MRKRRYSRRDLLKSAALGAAGVAIHPIIGRGTRAYAQTGTAGKFMVVINMLGGNDGINMVCPTQFTPYAETVQNGGRRDTITLARTESQGGGLPDAESLHDLDGNFALHYNLPNLAQCWADNDLHIVNKVSYPNPNQSHFTSQDIMSIGTRDLDDTDGRGWLGRFADIHGCDDPLSVVSIGGPRKDFRADDTDPLIISNVANVNSGSDPLDLFRVEPDIDYDSANPPNNDHFLREEVMRGILNTDPVPGGGTSLSVFNSNQQAYELVDRIRAQTQGWVANAVYPNTTLGNRLRAASQLLHGLTDFGTKILYTSFGGFDTHSNQLSRHASLMAQLDGAIGAFITDLKNHTQGNLFNDVVVVVISEFGRRVFENGSAGTDHGHGQPFFVLGADVNGKDEIGSGHTSPPVEADLSPPNNVLPFGVDFRNIYVKTMQDHLGVDTSNLFPDPGYQQNPGQVADIL